MEAARTAVRFRRAARREAILSEESILGVGRGRDERAKTSPRWLPLFSARSMRQSKTRSTWSVVAFSCSRRFKRPLWSDVDSGLLLVGPKSFDSQWLVNWLNWPGRRPRGGFPVPDLGRTAPQRRVSDPNPRPRSTPMATEESEVRTTHSTIFSLTNPEHDRY